MLVIEFEPGAGGLGADQGVNQDQTAVALDDRHVGQVHAANLVDAFAHLEQAGDVVQLRHAPQAGVDAGRRSVAVEEVVGHAVPHHLALGVLDAAGEGLDQTAPGIREAGLVLERQALQPGLVERASAVAGRLGRRRVGLHRGGKSERQGEGAEAESSHGKFRAVLVGVGRARL